MVEKHSSKNIGRRTFAEQELWQMGTLAKGNIGRKNIRLKNIGRMGTLVEGTLVEWL